MSYCVYPNCKNEAEFECVVCKQRFCAFHTYEQNSYVCKNHFNEPAFVDPHAPRNLMADAIEMLEQWIDKLVGKPKR